MSTKIFGVNEVQPDLRNAFVDGECYKLCERKFIIDSTSDLDGLTKLKVEYKEELNRDYTTSENILKFYCAPSNLGFGGVISVDMNSYVHIISNTGYDLNKDNLFRFANRPYQFLLHIFKPDLPPGQSYKNSQKHILVDSGIMTEEYWESHNCTMSFNPVAFIQDVSTETLDTTISLWVLEENKETKTFGHKLITATIPFSRIVENKHIEIVSANNIEDFIFCPEERYLRRKMLEEKS